MVEELQELRMKLKEYRVKSEKEEILRSIRKLEKMLDIEHIPYNRQDMLCLEQVKPMKLAKVVAA